MKFDCIKGEVIINVRAANNMQSITELKINICVKLDPIILQVQTTCLLLPSAVNFSHKFFAIWHVLNGMHFLSHVSSTGLQKFGDGNFSHSVCFHFGLLQNLVNTFFIFMKKNGTGGNVFQWLECTRVLSAIRTWHPINVILEEIFFREKLTASDCSNRVRLIWHFETLIA